MVAPKLLRRKGVQCPARFENETLMTLLSRPADVTIDVEPGGGAATFTVVSNVGL